MKYTFVCSIITVILAVCYLAMFTINSSSDVAIYNLIFGSFNVLCFVLCYKEYKDGKVAFAVKEK